MGNLSELQQDTTHSHILDYWKSKNTGNRRHLGASQIGKRCERALFYQFRWAVTPEFDGRLMRLFDRGHREEDTFIEELKAVGCVFYEQEDGEQLNFGILDGHFGGSCDGVIASGVIEAPKSPHIAEFKTHSNKSFNDLHKKGVQESKPEHYFQMQTYMGMTGDMYGASNRIERALYVAVNKDNDQLHVERVRYDAKAYESMKAKADRIIFTNRAPVGISQDPQWYECKWCDYYGLCHQQKMPEVNCRTCAHSTPIAEGKWSCAYLEMELDDATEREGCQAHIYNPTLIDTWAKAVDAGDDWVQYEYNDGEIRFTNAIQASDQEGATSEELFCGEGR